MKNTSQRIILSLYNLNIKICGHNIDIHVCLQAIFSFSLLKLLLLKKKVEAWKNRRDVEVPLVS